MTDCARALEFADYISDVKTFRKISICEIKIDVRRKVVFFDKWIKITLIKNILILLTEYKIVRN